MRIRFTALLFSGTLLAVSLARGQEIFMSSSWQYQGDTITAKFSDWRPFFAPAVTGAPFTADRVSEHTQTLVDGTHIRRPTNSQHIARDSQGRTRTERSALPEMALGGPRKAGDFKMVEIIDPAAGFAYVLDDQNKVAHRVALPATRQPMAGAAVATVGFEPVSSGAAERGQPGQGGIAWGVAGGQMPDANRPQFITEKLESKNIEGVIAEGTRNVTTWPVDSRGNDRPIVETYEVWRSEDLKELALSKSSSPFNGESVTKLMNISREEPDASLFQPPSDYTIVDGEDSFTITIKRQ